jgi:hypothetical protein
MKAVFVLLSVNGLHRSFCSLAGEFVEVQKSHLAWNEGVKKAWNFDLPDTWSRMLQASTTLLAGKMMTMMPLSGWCLGSSLLSAFRDHVFAV